jgi:hypothetical protein
VLGFVDSGELAHDKDPPDPVLLGEVREDDKASLDRPHPGKSPVRLLGDGPRGFPGFPATEGELNATHCLRMSGGQDETVEAREYSVEVECSVGEEAEPLRLGELNACSREEGTE